MKTILGENYYTVDEVAEMIGLSRQSTAAYVREGVIPAVKIGNQWNVKESNIREYLNTPQNVKNEKSN